MKHIGDGKGVFDGRRKGLGRVRSLNSQFHSRGGEDWGQQFHENFVGSSVGFAEEAEGLFKRKIHSAWGIKISSLERKSDGFGR
jgi:hypothetical protein